MKYLRTSHIVVVGPQKMFMQNLIEISQLLRTFGCSNLVFDPSRQIPLVATYSTGILGFFYLRVHYANL